MMENELREPADETLSVRSLIEPTLQLREPGEPTLSVYHLRGDGPAVVYVHGAFPAALSIAYPIDGRSWVDDLAARGLDVWSFDLCGYGASERPAAMQGPPVAREKVPGRASEVIRQLERVVAYIRENTAHSCVSLLAHSWGSIPTALFAGAHPDCVSRLVLFGPVAQREGSPPQATTVSPARFVSPGDQWKSFQSGVPNHEESPIKKGVFDEWAELYVLSDPTSRRRVLPNVAVPSGPDIDFEDAWSGRLPYDPSLVRAPTLIVRGEWDEITTDGDAQWLVGAMTGCRVRDVKLPRGAHRMHLESNRQTLFDVVGSFLTGDSA